jgi:hypothetical protein
MSKIIELPKAFTLKDKSITAVEVNYLRMARFTTLAEEVSNRIAPNQTFEAAFRSARMKEQTTLISDKKERITPDLPTIIGLPIPVAKLIIKDLDENEDAAGEIIADGDGISTPILYKLGTPVAVDNGAPIEELEFMAKVYGDIENVIGESSPFQRALALLRHVAKPAGLLALPSWALDQITIADGKVIAEKIVPRFTE